MHDAQAQTTRQAIAEGNVEAILDAAQRLLHRREQPNISAVATEAGVSRPTVYAHFPNRQRLLEALVERHVRRTMAAIESAEPERGPTGEALQRLLAASWKEVARNEDIARASASDLSTDAMRRAHQTARPVVRKLVERGRREGTFRGDVASDWLVTSCLALIHAAAEEVRADALDSDAALHALSLTVADLFAGPRASS
jgi:AcrR family transcriptional regulator